MPRVSIDHIAIDPDYCSGKPRIAGTRMPVATIAQLHLEMGETLEEIAAEYHLSPAAVSQALKTNSSIAFASDKVLDCKIVSS